MSVRALRYGIRMSETPDERVDDANAAAETETATADGDFHADDTGLDDTVPDYDDPDDDATADGRTDDPRDVDTSHLDGVDDGCGCTEVWEHLSEEREADD